MTFEIEGRDKVGPIRLAIDADNQFEGGGRWLRGGLHSHVAQMGEPEAVCDHYRGLGFDFLATTDYLSITPMPEATESFFTIPGAEVFWPEYDDLMHIICLGLQEVPRPLDGTVEDVARLARDTEAQGGLAFLPHPAWSDYSWEKALTLARSGLSGFELSNRLAWQINGKERAEELWQMLLNAGARLPAIGVDDATVLEDAAVTGQTWTGALVQPPRGGGSPRCDPGAPHLRQRGARDPRHPHGVAGSDRRRVQSVHGVPRSLHRLRGPQRPVEDAGGALRGRPDRGRVPDAGLGLRLPGAGERAPGLVQRHSRPRGHHAPVGQSPRPMRCSTIGSLLLSISQIDCGG